MNPLHDVLVIFSGEVKEQSARVSEALLAVQQAGSVAQRRKLLGSVARDAHSIKGNSGTLGLPELEEFAHALESALQPYLAGERAVPGNLTALVLTSLDQMQAYVDAAVAERPRPSLAEATASFRSETSSLQPSTPLGTGPTPPVPSSPSPTTPPSAPRPSAPLPAPAEGLQPHVEAETLRVSLGRLQALDHGLEEIRAVRSSFEQRAEDSRQVLGSLNAALASRLGGLDRDLTRTLRDQTRALYRGLCGDLAEFTARLEAADDELRTLRTVPVETLLPALRRGIWEHARTTGKQAELAVSGTDVALDRRLLDELKDALLHLMRNALDHGLETPRERARLGKPLTGVLRLTVEQRGNRAQLTFSDDGRGIDLEAVRATAVARGLHPAESAAELGEAQLLELLFLAGFSTAAQVSLTSGRGVGLDVVRDNVMRVGGKVSVAFERGKGTVFTLDLPLTLASAQALMVECGKHQLLLPLSAVAMSRHLKLDGPVPAVVDLGGHVLPLYSLAGLLKLDELTRPSKSFPVLVLKSGERLLAVRVDRVKGERDVVVRPLPPELGRLPALDAATTLGDGTLAFMLNPRALLELASGTVSPPVPARVGRRRRIVVADDSITTRTLHQKLLEAAGFEVETANDGEEASRILRERGADLLVSDVRMPRLDGLGLTRRVRQDTALSSMPIILVSSLDSEEDRSRAAEAGASAYLAKGAYERGELLRLAKELLP